MPAEHYRPNGDLSQGYYCGVCGGKVSMMGHNGCTPNPNLVKLLDNANKKKPHFIIGYKEKSTGDNP